MPDVHFILRGQTTRTLQVENGRSLMQAAVQDGIPGIVGECGGSAMCGTCHVYVAPEFANLLPAPNRVEEEMLDGVEAERRATSRLSCQITMRPELDGIIVEIPAA